MGLDNRAWIEHGKGGDTYQPNYIKSTLKFDVDMSDVGCNCAAGVLLVNLDDDSCEKDKYFGSSTPQCSTVDVMKANDSGF